MPQESQIPVMRAALLELAGQTDRALQLLDSVQRRWPELAAAWVARGMIHAAHERYTEARQALETAVSLGAHSPEALSHFADSILRSAPTRTTEAESAIRQALRLAPHDPWIQNLAAQVRKDTAATPGRPAEAVGTPSDPRRLFQSRPPRDW